MDTKKAEAIERLRAILKPGDTIYCVLHRGSRSGRVRWIAFYSFDAQGKKHYLSGYVSRVLCLGIEDMDQNGGIRVGSVDVVSTLSRALYSEGFECGCPTSPNTQPRPSWHTDRSTYAAFHSEWL